jgi:hypothetical protein
MGRSAYPSEHDGPINDPVDAETAEAMRALV